MEERNEAISEHIHRVGTQDAKWNDWTVNKAVKEGYKKSGWVYKAVSLIAKQGATVPFLVKNSDGEFEREHALSMLLAKPHPFLTRTQWTELLLAWLELCGNAYLRKVQTGTGEMPTGGNKQTKELWPVSPDRLAPIPARKMGEWMDGYEYIDANGVKKRSDDYTPENVTHLRLIDPSNPLLGIGPLQSAARGVDLDNQQQDWNLATMQNRGVVDGVFAFKKDIDNKQAESIMERIREKFGVKRAREPLVVGSEATYTKLGLTAVELDFLNSRKFNREEILGIFGVPPQLVGSEAASTYNNFSNAMRVLWEGAVLPLLDTLTSQFNHTFSEELEEGLVISYDRTAIPALQTSEEEKSQTAKNYWELGVPVATLNDKLELGLQEFEGWDEPWTGKSQGTTVPTDDSEGDEEERSTGWKLVPVEERSAKDEADRRNQITDGPLQKMYADLLSQQQADVMEAIERGEDGADAVRNTRETWLKATTNAVVDIAFDFAGTVAVDERGRPPSFERRNDPELEDLLDSIMQEEAWILEEVSLIEANTTQTIIDQARNAAENGLTTAEFQQALLDTGIFDDARALRISRTVGGTASSMGQWAGAKTAGATEKVWSTSIVEVRDIHTAREGERVPIDNRFSVQAGSVGPRFPLDPQIDVSDRVNCRCFLQFN
jgi:HK97 family phage portal protein